MSVKNILGTQLRDKYTGLDLNITAADGRIIASSAQYLVGSSRVAAGGMLGAIRVDDINSKSPVVTGFKGHKGQIHDVVFSPFYPSIFLSSSDDCTMKLWEMLPNLSKEKHDSVVDLVGHDRRVTSANFNPVADWVVASTSTDQHCGVWDLIKCQNVSKVHIQQPGYGCDWNYNGSLVGLTSEKKEIHIIDPRSSSIVCSTGVGHPGREGARMCWAQNNAGAAEHYFVSVGCNNRNKRDIATWDMRNIDKSLMRINDDFSSSLPLLYFDPAINVLYVTGRGDSSIKPYEVTNGTINPLPVFAGKSATATCWVPKRLTDVKSMEIARAVRIEDKKTITLCSFTNPRRTPGFDKTIFPDCPEGTPALGPAAWFGGENASPILGSMNPDSAEFPKRIPEPTDKMAFKGSAVGNTAAVLKKELDRTTTLLEEAEDKLGTTTKKYESKVEEVQDLQKKLQEAMERLASYEAQQV